MTASMELFVWETSLAYLFSSASDNVLTVCELPSSLLLRNEVPWVQLDSMTQRLLVSSLAFVGTLGSASRRSSGPLGFRSETTFAFREHADMVGSSSRRSGDTTAVSMVLRFTRWIALHLLGTPAGFGSTGGVASRKPKSPMLVNVGVRSSAQRSRLPSRCEFPEASTIGDTAWTPLFSPHSDSELFVCELQLSLLSTGSELLWVLREALWLLLLPSWLPSAMGTQSLLLVTVLRSKASELRYVCSWAFAGRGGSNRA
mmetsp:Transcript_66395/g.184993  ORF Transcript_66395/g.184993 Transcript_66395/m.184993 type:complete len:258 (+) Transcript_66395:266-1039(+)